MERLRILFIRSIFGFSLFVYLSNTSLIVAQGNCLQYPKDSGERKACELCYTNEYKQGSKESLMLYDSAITIGPEYAWAYYQKSVPYFKRGYLSDGIKLLNKAVELDPQSHICYRAYWYHQHKSYEACIRDLELYYSSYGGYVEFTPGGNYEMRMLLGISYAEMNDLDSAIRVITDYLGNPKNEMHSRAHDFFILGVLYYRNKEYRKAEEVLDKHIEKNPQLAEAYYYLGLVLEAQSKPSAKEKFIIADKIVDGKVYGYTRRILGIPSIKELKESNHRTNTRFVD